MLATCHRRQRPRYSILEPQTMVNKAPPFRVHLKGYPFKGPFTNHPYLSFSMLINHQFIYFHTQNFYWSIHLFIYFLYFFHTCIKFLSIHLFIYFFIFFIYTHTYAQNYNHEKIFHEKNCKICVCKVAACNDNRNLQ